MRQIEGVKGKNMVSVFKRVRRKVNAACTQTSLRGAKGIRSGARVRKLVTQRTASQCTHPRVYLISSASTKPWMPHFTEITHRYMRTMLPNPTVVVIRSVASIGDLLNLGPRI